MTDVYTFGEAMLRLSSRPGHALETAPSYDVHVAGAEANVAATLSRLGRSVAFATALPDGALGRRVVSELQAAGVDCSGVVIKPGARIGTYFVELRDDPLPTRVIYDRAGSAATRFGDADVRWDLFDQASIFHVSGITPALSQTCKEIALEMARRARGGDKLLSVDVNYRSKLWSTEEAASVLSQLIQRADIVVCTQEDCRDLFEIDGDPAPSAAEIAGAFDVRSVVVTSGISGAWWHADGSPGGHVPALQVEVIDRIGAGDAFTAGVLDGVLDDDLGIGVRLGTALAALALTTRGDRPVVSREEVESLLLGADRTVDR